MFIFRYLRYLYWERFLGGLYGILLPILGEEMEYEWLEPMFKLGVTLVILFLLREIYIRVQMSYTRYRLWKSMDGYSVQEPHTQKDTSFIEEIDAAQYPVHTIAQLKREKRYGRIGEVLAKLNQPEEAARWFLKDKQYERAAGEYARAGKTLKAARMLKRIGDYDTAARFYETADKYKQAAAIYRKQGNTAKLAESYIKGGYYSKGMEVFLEYFVTSTEPQEKQEAIADLCYQLLQQYNFANTLQTQQRNTVLNAVAQRFRTAGRIALAARIFQEAGDTFHASEMYKMNPEDILPEKAKPTPKKSK